MGPPRHPSFPSGHSFLGHFIPLLLLEIPQVAARYGEPTLPEPPFPNPMPAPAKPLVKPSLAKVMSTAYVFTGPLLWLGARLARNRERAGLHYRSDSLAGRWLAGAICALLTANAGADATPPGAAAVADAQLIDCPSLRRVLNMAKAEWL